MKRILKLLLPVICFSTVIKLSAQGTSFTYQGRLNDNGTPATGIYDMAFSLYGVSSGGSMIGSAITNAPTPVTNGLFSVTLDFGNAFPGNPRWLEIRVRPYNGGGPYTFLSPRQQLTPTPYSIFSGGASNAVTATTITGSLPSSGLAGGYTNTVNFNSISNSFTGFFAGNGAGLTNVPGGFLVWRIFESTNLFALANTGYVLTSSNYVNVTLPDTTNISDLVRVAGVGTGGWKILCRPSQNIFVNNLAGAIGTTWLPVATSQSWFSIACSLDGVKLAAVYSGSGAIFTSSDSGATWTLRLQPLDFRSVASSANGERLVAGIGGFGQVYGSSDSGLTWSLRGSSPAANWVSIASSDEGNKLVACTFGSQLRTSTDYGTNWVARDSNRNWIAAASSSDGTKLVAVVTNGFIYTSVNSGANWTARQNDSNRAWHGVASSADGVKLAACVYGGRIWTSTDSGATWKTNGPNASWSSIASSSDGNRLVATVFGGKAYVSGDAGATWTTLASTPTANWWTVCSSQDGTKLAGAARTGNIYISAPTFNVTTSGYITGGQGSAIELLSAGNGQFIPISFIGQIFAY